MLSYLMANTCYGVRDLEVLPREHCRDILSLRHASEHTERYYQAVLGQGRQFYVAEFNMLEAEATEVKEERAYRALYGELLPEQPAAHLRPAKIKPT